MELQTTCWRALQLQHPPQWEIALACGPEGTQRIILADRHFHRLDVRWRPLKYVPNLDLMLSRHKQPKKDQDIQTSPLSNAPEPWKGLVQETPDGTVTHAGRHFHDARLLVEATLVWPNERDMTLESEILASIAPVQSDIEPRPWQAMGLSLQCPSRFELLETDLKVGKVQWDFRQAAPGKPAQQGKHSPLLEVNRIAMPEYWLKNTPLREWLRDQIPKQFTELRVRAEQQGLHTADIIVSSARGPLLSSFGGTRQLRLDMAWACPAENRVYHIHYTRLTMDDQAQLHEGFALRCCRGAPNVGQGQVIA